LVLSVFEVGVFSSVALGEGRNHHFIGVSKQMTASKRVPTLKATCRDRDAGFRHRARRNQQFGEGMRGAARAREANLIFVLPPNVYMGPPVGGLFGFKFSSRPHPWKFGVKRFLVLREVLARKWGGLFWATSLEKIIGGVTAIVSYRPGGWMQQSTVPRCAILSVGSTGRIEQ
jgi:hypothetical protein